MSTAPAPRMLREDQPAYAVDGSSVRFNPWDYGQQLATSGVAGKVGAGPYVVLHAIASHADEHWQAFPSIARLSRDTGLGNGLISGHIITLIECGALTRRPRKVPGKRTSTLYTILPLSNIVEAASKQRRRQQTAQARSAKKVGCSVDQTEEGRSVDRNTSFCRQNKGRSVDSVLTNALITKQINQPSESGADKPRGARTVKPVDLAWMPPIIEGVKQAAGWKQCVDTTAEKIAAILYPRLNDCTEAERQRFIHYLKSNDFVRDNRHRLTRSLLAEEADAWLNDGMPASKPQRQAAPRKPVNAAVAESERLNDGFAVQQIRRTGLRLTKEGTLERR